MKTTHRTRMNMFEGPDAIRYFLDPDKNPPLPLVELPAQLNPFAKDRVRIFAKLMNFLPLGNVKSLPSYNMLLEERRRGRLKSVRTLIESSSGNTVLSLAVIGRAFGIPQTKAIVSHEVTQGKLQLLRLFGTDVIINHEPICPDPGDPESGIHKARRMGKRSGWLNPGQYENVQNPRAHQKWTGPQLWLQTKGKISVFCAGLGTCGTVIGTGSYLKKRAKNLTIIGVARKPNNPVPGVRTPNLLQEIAFDWRTAVDAIEEIGTKESFTKSLELCRAGLLAGPSSGFALAGLMQFLSRARKEKKLNSLRNREGEVYAAFICPDTPLPYLNEYFEYLGESAFPKIRNKQLLLNKQERLRKSAANVEEVSAAKHELVPQELYRLAYSLPARKLWNVVNRDGRVTLKRGITILDLRKNEEFSHYHLPGSRQIDPRRLIPRIQQLRKQYFGKKLIFVCQAGVRSLVMASLASKYGINAFSLKGGLAEWSQLDLPRSRPQICVEFSRKENE